MAKLTNEQLAYLIAEQLEVESPDGIVLGEDERSVILRIINQER